MTRRTFVPPVGHPEWACLMRLSYVQSTRIALTALVVVFSACSMAGQRTPRPEVGGTASHRDRGDPELRRWVFSIPPGTPKDSALKGITAPRKRTIDGPFGTYVEATTPSGWLVTWDFEPDSTDVVGRLVSSSTARLRSVSATSSVGDSSRSLAAINALLAGGEDPRLRAVSCSTTSPHRSGVVDTWSRTVLPEGQLVVRFRNAPYDTSRTTVGEVLLLPRVRPWVGGSPAVCPWLAVRER